MFEKAKISKVFKESDQVTVFPGDYVRSQLIESEEGS